MLFNRRHDHSSRDSVPGEKRPDEVCDESLASLDSAAEKRALRKVDWHILPVVFLFYLFSFLDRTNIGNGRLYGLEEDLGLKGDRFQTATSILFATYVSCQLPASWLVKTWHPSRFIGGIAMLWGIVASLTGLTQNYGQFIACRLLLGLAEGPGFPVFVIYLTLFYSRRELAFRFAYLIAGGAMAGALGGIIAYGIGHMDGVQGYRAWRWLFIIEGIPSFCLGIFVWFYLADSPEDAWFLNPQECRFMAAHRHHDVREATTPSAQTLKRSDVIAAFKDWKTWAFVIQDFGSDVQLFSYSIFLPTIVKAIQPKWSSLDVQALTIPCYVWTTIVFFAVAYISDALQRRAVFMIAGASASIIGHIMLIAGKDVAVNFLGCFFIGTGLYVASGIGIVWMPSNLPRYGKRTTAVGLQLMLGNSGGIPAPYLYPTSDGPRYTMGHAVTIAMLALGIVMDVALWAGMSRTNRRRKAGLEDYKLEGRTDEEVDDLGDESPRYIYVT